jgi:hypothetical protein
MQNMTNHISKTFKGYYCEVQWDGITLKARGSNKAAHLALLGPADEAAIEAAALASIDKHFDDVDRGHIEQVKVITVMARTAVVGFKAAFDLADDLILTRGTFTVTEYTKPTLFVNGKLILTETANERAHEFHFLKKHLADFDALAKDLADA